MIHDYLFSWSSPLTALGDERIGLGLSDDFTRHPEDRLIGANHTRRRSEW
jgi:hypothetical protein